MEKLVEEWTEMLANALRLHLPPSEQAPADQYERVARRIVLMYGESILSAIRDGRLKLPDEVGRIPADMLGGGKGEVVHVREGDTIIILRQAGTGKEEEK